VGDSIEHAVVFACFRDVYRKLKLGTMEDIAKLINEKDISVPPNQALYCLQGKSFGKEYHSPVFHCVLRLLYENFKIVGEFYRKRNIEEFKWISIIINKYINGANLTYEIEHGISVAEGEGRGFAGKIFERWKQPLKRDGKVLSSGIYQMFRRYKPPYEDDGAPEEAICYWHNPINHAVICELMYVDAVKMECIFVTNEGRVYIGTLYINNEDTLFFILQRRSATTGLQHRFIVQKLHEKKLRMFSGICVKVGDTTERPVASEVIFTKVRATEHELLYKEMTNIIDGEIRESKLPDDSEIYRYLTDAPPSMNFDSANPKPSWSRVRFVRNFPALETLVKSGSHHSLLREPSRTLDSSKIIELSSQGVRIPVFMQEKKKSIHL